MNRLRKIIKKWFPSYETKREMRKRLAEEILKLEKELAFTKGANLQNGTILIQRDTVQIGASIEFGDRPIPTDVLKRRIQELLIQEIAPHIDYDIRDAEQYCGKTLIGRLYVALKK